MSSRQATNVPLMAPGASPEVDVRRSTRRRRTVSAYEQGGRIVVLIPAAFTAAQEREWVSKMVDRIQTKVSRQRPSDTELSERAEWLSARYLDGRAVPSSVRWVANQNTRWGSTSIGEGSIRLSAKLRGLPRWVVDYVLLHELAHLIEPNHSPQFWKLLESFPRTERARGFLDGYAVALQNRDGAYWGDGEGDEFDRVQLPFDA